MTMNAVNNQAQVSNAQLAAVKAKPEEQQSYQEPKKSSHTGAKILAALALIGAATYGVIRYKNAQKAKPIIDTLVKDLKDGTKLKIYSEKTADGVRKMYTKIAPDGTEVVLKNKFIGIKNMENGKKIKTIATQRLDEAKDCVFKMDEVKTSYFNSENKKVLEVKNNLLNNERFKVAYDADGKVRATTVDLLSGNARTARASSRFQQNADNINTDYSVLTYNGNGVKPKVAYNFNTVTPLPPQAPPVVAQVPQIALPTSVTPAIQLALPAPSAVAS